MKYDKELRIHLFADYYLIKPDRWNYCIAERRVVKKTKQEDFDAVGWYPNVRSLHIGIKRLYVSEMIMHSLKNDKLEKLIEDLERLDEKIMEVRNG